MSSFCTVLQKLLTFFFSKKNQHICVSLDVNFNESLTNDLASFEQLGPDQNLLGVVWKAKDVKLLLEGQHSL